MVWTHSVCPCLKSVGQQLRKTREKDNYYKHASAVTNINSGRMKSTIYNVDYLIEINKTTSTFSLKTQDVQNERDQTYHFVIWF